MILRFVQRSFAYIRSVVSPYWQRFSGYATRKWQQWQPRIDRIVHASIAISTATSAFKLSVEIIPIILSMLTVIATMPLLSDLLPVFVFDQTVIFFSVLTIACIAGYQKFRELALRAKLDAQIKINTSQGKQFERKIKKIKARLEKLEAKPPTSELAFSCSKHHTTAFQRSPRRARLTSVPNHSSHKLKYKVA